MEGRGAMVWGCIAIGSKQVRRVISELVMNFAARSCRWWPADSTHAITGSAAHRWRTGSPDDDAGQAKGHTVLLKLILVRRVARGDAQTDRIEDWPTYPEALTFRRGAGTVRVTVFDARSW